MWPNQIYELIVGQGHLTRQNIDLDSRQKWENLLRQTKLYLV